MTPDRSARVFLPAPLKIGSHAVARDLIGGAWDELRLQDGAAFALLLVRAVRPGFCGVQETSGASVGVS
jgi:hypothetical protein